MRFKSIFWLFNIVVLVALLLFSGLTFFLFGQEYAAVYWKNFWLVAVLFLLVVGGLDFFFVRNWRLFHLLESEDWPALLAWLEEIIYSRGRLNRLYANLLINTALSVGNYEAVQRLEAQVRRRKPQLIRTLGVSLGIPLLNAGNAAAVIDFYGPLADDPKIQNRSWACFCRASAQEQEGLSAMAELLQERDVSIRLLAFSKLSGNLDQLDNSQKEKLKAAFPVLKADMEGSAGTRKLQKSRDEHLLAHIFARQVDEIRTRLAMLEEFNV